MVQEQAAGCERKMRQKKERDPQVIDLKEAGGEVRQVNLRIAPSPPKANLSPYATTSEN